MQTLNVSLGENHGIALQHSAAVAPATVLERAAACGQVTSHSTYLLQDDTRMTLLFFTEAGSCDVCYAVFHGLVVGKAVDGYVNMGWINENSEAAFAKKPYVKGKLPASDGPTTTTAGTGQAAAAGFASAATEGNAYLLVYLSQQSAEQRGQIRAAAAALALELFEDDKEGGRLFCHFTDEDAGDACRDAITEAVGRLGRYLSYTDAADFALAKRGK